MARKVIFGLILSLFICNVSALQCRTCSGDTCNNMYAPMVECSSNVPKLPFDYKSPDISLEDAEYVCLELEYVEGQQIRPVHQCHLTTLYVDPCEDIKLQRKGELKHCKITRDVRGTTSTETPPTETPPTETPQTPTTEEPTDEPTETSTPSTTTAGGMSTTVAAMLLIGITCAINVVV